MMMMQMLSKKSIINLLRLIHQLNVWPQILNSFLFLFQDEHWGENTTAVTINSDLDYNDGLTQSQANGGPGLEMEKWRLETERGMGFRCKRHLGPLIACFLAMLALLSPILMAGLPKMSLFR